MIRRGSPQRPTKARLARQSWSLTARAGRKRAAGGGRKRCAALTIVQDEPVFFPLWLGYYSRFFAPADIYVLDHDTTDGSTACGGYVRIPVSHDTIDHRWMVRVIEEHQHELLDTYDVVLVSDVDEIVSPRPGCGTLGDYLDRFEEEFVNCRGYELIHLVDREEPFDFSRRVLDQRGYWFANNIYDKPALSTVPMHWKPGFHRTVDGEMRPDPDLYLIHLHRIDYEICRTATATATVTRGTSTTSSWAGRATTGSPRRPSSHGGSTRTATRFGPTS